MKTLSSWILGGALAASLTWNWTLHERLRAQAATPANDAGPACCALESGALGLDPDQSQALSTLCQRSCGESDRLERQADELRRALIASLSSAELDQAATDKLVGEVSELRKRSLASCVQGILGVRTLLKPEQLRQLLASCEQGAARSCR